MHPVITSRQNTRVRALRAALASRGDDDRIAIESPHLLREAFSSPDIRVETIFVREDQTGFLNDLPPGVEQVVLSADAFASAAATEHSQGVAALIARPEWRFLPRPGQLLLLLDGVQDPGNLGTVVRSAEAFGVAAIFVTDGTADIWNGKALRAAAGAAFRMPVVRWTAPLQAALRETGTRLLAAVVDREDAVPITEAPLTGSCILAIGSEGRGLSEATLATADVRVTLPMLGRTESLNAGVAGSILLYEAARQRRKVAR